MLIIDLNGVFFVSSLGPTRRIVEVEFCETFGVQVSARDLCPFSFPMFDLLYLE